jgi:hypothetical protein
VPFTASTIPVVNGVVSSTAVYATDCLAPRLPYVAQIVDKNGLTIYTDNWYLPRTTSGDVDVGTLSGVELKPAIDVSAPPTILAKPPSDQTITQPGSTFLKVNRLQVLDLLDFGGTVDGNISGRATTMTEWQSANQFQCPPGFYMTGIFATGDAKCSNLIPPSASIFTSLYVSGVPRTLYGTAGSSYVNYTNGASDFIDVGGGGFQWFVSDPAGGAGNAIMTLAPDGVLTTGATSNVNVPTMAAFANTPLQCPNGKIMTGIAANGDASCVPIPTPAIQKTVQPIPCTTGNNSFSTCTGNVVWPTAFQDTNYDVVCTGIGPSNPRVLMQGIVSKTLTNAQYVLVTEGSVAATFDKVQCVGMANPNTTGGGNPPPKGPRIPSNAVTSGILDGSNNWAWQHDPGTTGSSSGTSTYPNSSPSLDGHSRLFTSSYTDFGGELFHLSFGADTAPTHFVYDLNVYVVNPPQLQNLELDMNHVIPNGDTVILATQCASGSATWEVTINHHWHPSNLPCKVTTWAPNQWHHIQIATHHDSLGNVTYDWIGFDGVYSDFIGQSGPQASALNWHPIGDMLINFQIDGSQRTSGSITVYANEIQVWRW